MRRADLIVLLGKALDFTTQWASGPTFDPAVRLIAIDPEAALVDRAGKEMDGTARARQHRRRARRRRNADRAAPPRRRPRDGGWLDGGARRARQPARRVGDASTSQTPGRLHPAQVFRALRPYVERDPDTVLICDGGEFAQWGAEHAPGAPPHDQRRRGLDRRLALVRDARRVSHEPKAPVFVVLGDGTIGFHLSEFETAVRRKLPFVAVLGNDALWNAESQIQLREYGRERMHGCDLMPARYDLAVAALGGHGEYVERAEDLPGAIERALASGKPACINVMIESIAAPVIRL